MMTDVDAKKKKTNRNIKTYIPHLAEGIFRNITLRERGYQA